MLLSCNVCSEQALLEHGISVHIVYPLIPCMSSGAVIDILSKPFL